jgi:hypothetical protein
MAALVTASALTEDLVNPTVLLGLAIAIVSVWITGPVVMSLSCLSPAPREESEFLIYNTIEDKTPRQDLDDGLTLPQMVQTLDFWLLLWSCIAIAGSGISVTTNAAEMFETIGSHVGIAPTVFSLTQSFSRVFAGALCGLCAKRGLPCVVITIGAVLVMIGAETCFIINTKETLFAGVALAGLAFGANWPSIVVIVSELFGTKHLGGNYMLYDGTASVCLHTSTYSHLLHNLCLLHLTLRVSRSILAFSGLRCSGVWQAYPGSVLHRTHCSWGVEVHR